MSHPPSREYREVVVERFQKDPAEAMAYLELAVEEFQEDQDMRFLLLALRTVTEAQGGVPKLARQIGMQKMTLYKALSEQGNPRLSTLQRILEGLGLRMSIAPVAASDS